MCGKQKDFGAGNNIFLRLADLENGKCKNRYDAQELGKSPRESHNFTDVPHFTQINRIGAQVE